MKFILKEYVPICDEDIIKDIDRVAKQLNVSYLSISQYKQHGKYSQCAIQNHFGTWTKALALAGLRNERNSEDRKRIKDSEYLMDLKRVAKLMKSETVTLSNYEQFGKYPSGMFFHRFKTWDNALILAELQPTGLSLKRISEQECYNEIERIWRLLGKQPTSNDIRKLSKYSLDTFTRRFGGWRNALSSFVEYINENREEDNNEGLQETEKSPIEGGEKEIIVETAIRVRSTQKRTSRNINTRLRFKVLQRDHFRCCACGASPAKDSNVELHVDHIIPWSKGGETVMENLQTLCSKCNLGKSNME